MATRSTTAAPRNNTPAARPAAANKPASKPSAPRAEANRSAGGANKPGDNFRQSDELREARDARRGNKPGEAKDPNKPADAKDPNKPGDVKDPNKPDEAKDPNKPEDPKKPEDPNKPADPNDPLAEEKKKNEELTKKVDDLEKMLDALLNGEDEKKPEEQKPEENKGGCCNSGKKPSEAQKPGEGEGEQDYNKILMADVAAVKAARNGEQPKQPQGGKPGEEQIKDPFTKLTVDFVKAKTSGAQLKPEVEQMVLETLLEGAQGGQGNKQGQDPFGGPGGPQGPGAIDGPGGRPGVGFGGPGVGAPRPGAGFGGPRPGVRAA